MIYLDAAQLRNAADALAGLNRIERETGVQIDGGHAGTVAITVDGSEGTLMQVLDVVRVEAADGARYLLRVGD